MLSDVEWKNKGKCMTENMNPEYFYVTIEDTRHLSKNIKMEDVEIHHAGYCRGIQDGKPCPVLLQCRDYAVKNREMGIWGGTTEKERERIRKRKRAIIAATRRDEEMAAI